MNLNDVSKALGEGKLVYHHTAWTRGYVSRKGDGARVEPYSGRFGTGVKVHYASWDSTRYHHVSYYINAA